MTASTRFLGGSPLAVAFRLVLLSILVGVVLAAIGFDPLEHRAQHPAACSSWIWDLGFDAVNWLWRYFLLGAVIVVPIWIIVTRSDHAARREAAIRLLAPRSRSRPRRSSPSPVRRWWRT